MDGTHLQDEDIEEVAKTETVKVTMNMVEKVTAETMVAVLVKIMKTA